MDDNRLPFSDVPDGYELCALPDGEFGASHGPLYWRRDCSGFAFRAETQHRNRNGTIHGGMLLTLTDQVLGLTVERALDGQPSATVSLNCDLIGSAHPGDLIEGTAQVTRITSSVVFVLGSLRCSERLILTASGLWKRLRPRQAACLPFQDVECRVRLDSDNR
jgi:acyl-coenzyme A thioesterase PaaI-like protein